MDYYFKKMEIIWISVGFFGGFLDDFSIKLDNLDSKEDREAS